MKYYYIENTFALVALVSNGLSCQFHEGYHGNIVVLVFLFRVGYHGGMIGPNTRRLLFPFSYSCIFILALVPSRSQVIALRRSYCDNCSCYYFYYYYKSIILVYCFPLLLVLFQAGHM
jgi:hypothetical protein